MAMRAELPESRQEARETIRRLLRSGVNLDAMRAILWEAADGLAPMLAPEDPVAAIVRAMARLGIEAALRMLRRAKSLSPDWYGHRDRDLHKDPLDVLVDLNSWAKEGLTHQVNELLWEAFLADLREDFRTSRHAPEMTLNCVVVLDDCDTPLGQEFVNGLVDARKDRQALGMDPADPLTVVATSRGELLSGVPRRELVEFTGSGTEHELTNDPHDEPHWWCRYALAELSERETGVLVSALASAQGGNVALIGHHQLTPMVYGLAGGHPASTAKLVEAIRERPLEHGDTLMVLLDRAEPGRDPDRPLLKDSLRQQLLGEFTEDTYDDLVTCAAARTKQHASLLAARGELLVGGINSYREIAPVLWPASGGAGPVVLRRLLVRQLAARGDDDAANWATVVDWFRTRCAQDGDEEGVLHYAMAAGDIATACEGLRQRLATDDPEDWVRLLRSVTSMPRTAGFGSGLSPMDQLRAAIDKRSQRLTRLVVARWIAFDPFVSNRRRALHRQIAADYDFVAGLAQGDPEPLLDEADYHRKQAELWS
ncbi:hypothetical protein [Amycolatopsis sp. NPDC059021]|uniref:hypothetical protein n=1 Tax=Amycolatopsis sp. NPDC059021 TaxID=3346704 RepID=UPI00366E3B67